MQKSYSFFGKILLLCSVFTLYGIHTGVNAQTIPVTEGDPICFEDGNYQITGNIQNVTNLYTEVIIGDGVIITTSLTADDFLILYEPVITDTGRTIQIYIRFDGIYPCPSKDMLFEFYVAGNCKLIACDATDKTVVEDGCEVGYYTHRNNSWNVTPLNAVAFDSVTYTVNEITVSRGRYATLNGVRFTIGTNTVQGIAYYETLTDTCEFTVEVEAKPIPTTPVIVSNPYPAFQGMPIDLISTLANYNPAYTYTFYSDSAGLVLIGSVITFTPPKTDYYVRAWIGECESDLVKIVLEDPCEEYVWDIEGNPYKVTSLAGYCWTENLKSKIYNCSLDPIPFARVYNCRGCADDLEDTFGLLYNWYSAMGVDADGNLTQEPNCICPAGYHLPTRLEWSALGSYDASQLRSADFWIEPPGAGSDEFGWDARPAGWFNSASRRFEDLYGYTGWWSSDAYPGAATAYIFYIAYFCDQIQQELKKKGDGLSVRCVMDY